MEQLEVIQSKIYDIRGQKVMLDRDLAEMYGVEPRALNQAVKRNTDRFPIDFMFQLTDEKTEIKDGHTNKHGHYAVLCCCSSVTVKSFYQSRYMNYNDINDDTRMQLELINQTLAELQVQKALADKPRNPIGFITPKKK